MEDELDISIITSNTDLGQPLDISKENLNTWITKSKHRIIYLDQDHQNRLFLKKLFSERVYDVVYFNSLFSFKFTLLPFWMLRNATIRRVLATRGMLGKGALAIKPLKKKLFLNVFKLLKLPSKIVWHATAKSEVEEIKTHFGSKMKILLAPNLSARTKYDSVSKQKSENKINIFFLSRISEKKNLLGAIKILSKINESCEVNFTIIGPVEDEGYWGKCELAIHQLPKHIKIKNLGAIQNHELHQKLKDQHILLLPTFHENFGHVIMESWQNGCPVVISDQTPWRNLKSDNLGFDIDLDNQTAFIDAVESLCSMAQGEFNMWSKASLKKAKDFTENTELIQQNKALFLNT